ncbi:MAG: DUF3859 domain-containing protein [Burkholderiales bacterium]|jgi:hypothetical protein
MTKQIGQPGPAACGFVGSAVVAVALLTGVCLVARPALAQPGVKITEYGIYSEDHRLLRKTTTIPSGAPVRFGFCFYAFIDFHDDDAYMLVESLQHPPVGEKDGGADTGYSVPRMFKVREGTAHGCAGYRARSADDLRPGVWKFTISDGADELVVQEFTIE